MKRPFDGARRVRALAPLCRKWSRVPPATAHWAINRDDLFIEEEEIVELS